MKQNSVTCRDCGETVSDLTKTKTQIRKQLERKGWTVATPIYATQSPMIPKEEFYALHPELKGKTVDTCRPCMQKRMDEAIKKLNSGIGLEERARLAQIPDSPYMVQ